MRGNCQDRGNLFGNSILVAVGDLHNRFASLYSSWYKNFYQVWWSLICLNYEPFTCSLISERWTFIHQSGMGKISRHWNFISACSMHVANCKLFTIFTSWWIILLQHFSLCETFCYNFFQYPNFLTDFFDWCINILLVDDILIFALLHLFGLEFTN